MHKGFLLICIGIFSLGLYAQNPQQDIGTCFSRGNQKSIDKKMENFLEKVSKDLQCPIESISYTVVEKYTGFYTTACRHLPKQIEVQAQGKTYTYVHTGLSGAVGNWLLGSWKLEKK
jgi:hypothetical protein